MQIPIVLVRFSGQQWLEVRTVVSVRGFNEQVNCEVNGVKFSVRKLLGVVNGIVTTIRGYYSSSFVGFLMAWSMVGSELV